MAKEKRFGHFAFRFSDPITQEVAQIWSVGWDEQKSQIYHWNGIERKDIDKCIFQYTLSGYGLIEINGKQYKVSPGYAFIVSSPSNYRYFLPKDSGQWEFIYITLCGKEADRCWGTIRKKSEQVLYFHPESSTIQLLKQIYDEAERKKITNAFKASSLAYQFIMELYQHLSTVDKEMKTWPESIVRAVLYAKNHFQSNIGPDDMAAASGLSRYHFTRVFKKSTGKTPIQYLTNIRLEKAMDLLENTKYSVEDIAKFVGYRNANYLNKVFQKAVGCSPTQFRKGEKHMQPKDFI